MLPSSASSSRRRWTHVSTRGAIVEVATLYKLPERHTLSISSAHEAESMAYSTLKYLPALAHVR